MTNSKGLPEAYSHDHAVHHPVRRRRLRHAAVRAGLRTGGHARADEFRQSRAWRLRHGRRLCLRGAGQPVRLAVLRSLPLAFVASAADRRGAGARAVSSPLHRSHLDQVLFTIGLVFMSVAAVDYIMGSSRIFIKLPAALEGQIRFLRRRHRPLPADDHRDLRPADRGAATGAGAHAIRQPAARGGGRSARGKRARHQRAAGVRVHLCVRLRPCRSRRRARAPRSSASIRIFR